MNTTQQGIILLMKSAVTGEKLVLPADFDIEAAVPEINRHKIHTLVFQGAVNCSVPKKHPVMQQLFQKYCRAMLVSEGQMREVHRIYQAFDENGIDYMPLKGCNMKSRYPKPELRIMGDADILIRMEQYEKISAIIEALGFSFKCESDHELIWQSGSLYLELHKRLVPSYQRDLSPFFDGCWERAEVTGGTRYGMLPEDEWIFLFTHFAKHCRDSGIGCRHVVDLWVFLRSYPQLRESYVMDALERLQLLEFYENMRKLMRVWFEQESSDDMTEILTAYIFESGNWGDAISGVLSGVVRNSRSKAEIKRARLQYLWRYAFPSLEIMQRRHKILKKAPWLLPVMWVVRLLYKALFDKKEQKRVQRNFSVITEENIQNRQTLLRLIGLDYH